MSLHILIFVWMVVGSLLALLTVPGTLELLFLTLGGILPARKRKATLTDGARQKLAIVIPAHDEEAGITACIESVLGCHAARETYSVVVVADNCTDRTGEKARKAGARVLTRNDDARRGKGYALDYAFTRLSAEGYHLFIVIDADSSVTPNLVDAFRAAFASGAYALQCRYRVRNSAESIRTRWMNIALMAFNVLRPRGRDRFGVSAGILGNGFGLSSKTLQQVPYTAVSVVEDLEYHLRLVRAGLRVQFVDAVTVFGEMPTGGSGVATQRSRWEGGRLRMISQFVPQLMGEVLRGRFRLLEPLFELLLLPLAFQVGLLLLAMTTPIALVRFYAAGALGLAVVHMLAGVMVGGGSWRDVSTLLLAPWYLIWKLRMLPSLFRSARQDTTWIRTEREAVKGERL